MKTELKAKFLQHLNKKREDKGFTLIELLVVIIIIGILAAIALPTFLNQTGKAKQSEAKQNVSSINRTQTSYRAEKNQFATSFNVLAIGTLDGVSNATTTNYTYKIDGGTNTATITSAPVDKALKSYSGGTVRYVNAAGNSVINSILCEVNKSGVDSTAPTLSDSATTPATVATCGTSGDMTKLDG